VTAEKDEVLATVNGVPIPMVFLDFMKQERTPRDSPKPPTHARRTRSPDQCRSSLAGSGQAGPGQGSRPGNAHALVRKELLAKALIDDYLRKHPVSDEAIQAEFDKIKAKSGDKEYHVRHILVSSDKDAKAIIAKLKKASFEKLAKEEFKDSSAAQGGTSAGRYRPIWSRNSPMPCSP
jgi:peptidyl-prolyl cis-trans isomerase C